MMGHHLCLTLSTSIFAVLNLQHSLFKKLYSLKVKAARERNLGHFIDKKRTRIKGRALNQTTGKS